MMYLQLPTMHMYLFHIFITLYLQCRYSAYCHYTRMTCSSVFDDLNRFASLISVLKNFLRFSDEYSLIIKN